MKQIWEINSQEDGPHVLLLAGVHGDEYEPMVALVELAEELSQTLNRGRVTINTLVNASAFKMGSRLGDDGLDLARTCPGVEKGSSSERAAFAISQQIRQADVVIDLHTGGLAFEIYPLVGYMLHSDEALLSRQRELATATGMSLIWGTDDRPDGRTLSVARDAGVPAIYLEYGGGSGFRIHVADKYKRAVRSVLQQLSMLTPSEHVASNHQYWLEDHRRDSGYLQGRMPAPVAGIFVAEVSIGDRIHSGQQFGRIVNPYTGEITVVKAEKTGLVFLLRSLVKVEKGDALGGIMHLTENKKIVIKDDESSTN